MQTKDPIQKSREDYEDLIEKISQKDSPVGIDAQYTHAIIIEYLRQIDMRLSRLEDRSIYK
ncbi:MAG: hypothetical protein ACE5I1_31810 [bacterium]